MAVRESNPATSFSLSGAAAALMIGSLIAQGAMILSMSIVARLVSKTEVGTYQQLSLIYLLAAPLFLGGVPAALLYFIPRAENHVEIQDWIIRAYLLLTSFGISLAICIVAFRHPIASALHNPRLAPALIFYSPYICFAFLTAAAPNVLVATGKVRAAAIVNAAVGACTLIGVTTAALIRPDAQALAAGLSVAGGATSIVSFGIIIRILRIGFRLPPLARRPWLALLSFGLPLAFGGVTARIGYQFDQVIVSTHFRTDQFAVYALGAVELPISQLLQQAVSNVLAPTLAICWREGDLTGMADIWREAIRKTTLAVMPMFAFLMVEASDLIHILYGPRFNASSNIFRIYLLLMPLRIATWGLIPQAAGRTKILFAAAWIVLPVNIVVAIESVGPLGLRGPAFAAPAAALVATLYYIVWIRRIVAVPFRALLPLREGISCSAVVLLTALSIVPLQWLDMPSAARLMVAGLVFLPFTVLILKQIGLITNEDWLRVRSLVPIGGEV
jgi:O-antigen/teichoic acid export membrane protein